MSEATLVAVRRRSQEAGGCNFCNVHTTSRGETSHDVTEVRRSDGVGLYVRFCDACMRHLRSQTSWMGI